MDVYQKSVFPLDVIAMKPGYSLRWRRLTNSQTDISLQLREETRFSGVLRDDAGQPVADATIRVRNLMSLNTITQIDVAGGHTTSQNGDSFLDISESVACIAATTDEAGRFVLRELPNRVGMVLGVDDDRLVDTQWYAATTTEELPDIPAGKLIFPPRPKTAGQIIQQRVRAELLPIHVSLAKLPVTRGVHVRIRVLDDETGAPVSGAVVALAGDARSDLQTNDVGVCDVSRLVPESSVVASVRPPEKSSLLGRSEPLALSSKLHVEREIRLKQGAIVTGRVMDAESGAGVADATVSFVPETGQVADAEQPIPATSDDAGAFRLVVPEVSGRVAVARPPAGYLQPSSAVSREGEREVTDSAITAKLDEPVEGLEIPLRRRPSIPFLFVDADGEPLAVTVDVRVFSSSNSYFSSIEEVDQSGMMDASLLIKSPQRPAAIQMLARSVDKRLAGFFRSKELTDLQGDEPYSIVLRPVASVEGQILDKETGRPISGARVRLSVSYTATGGQSVGSFTCGKEGRYKFQELVPGMRYALGVSADGYAALNSIHTQFVAAEGESHTVDIGLSPEKPKEVVGIEPVKTPAVDGLDPQEAYDVLAAAYDKAYNAYRDLLEKHESSQAKKQIVAIAEPTPVYATAFMKLANDNQGSTVELQALKWVCKARRVAGSERSHYPLRTEAAARLLADYRQREEIADAVSNIIYASSNAYDAAQRLMKSPHREVQGQAYYTCANILAQRYLDPHRGGHDVLREEAIALYEKVIEDYGEIVQWPGRSIGDAAREKLFELKKLQIGAAAPEIDGVDLDGKPMKLADFRGQVVVIYYWESGLAFFDRLKDMLDEYRGKPLVIVGVNTDRDRDLAITAAAQQGLAIRHWHDPERKIHRRWSGSWPDTHVIGHDGTLLYRGQRRSPKPLEDVLDQAVAAAEQAERE